MVTFSHLCVEWQSLRIIIIITFTYIISRWPKAGTGNNYIKLTGTCFIDPGRKKLLIRIISVGIKPYTFVCV